MQNLNKLRQGSKLSKTITGPDYLHNLKQSTSKINLYIFFPSKGINKKCWAPERKTQCLRSLSQSFWDGGSKKY